MTVASITWASVRANHDAPGGFASQALDRFAKLDSFTVSPRARCLNRRAFFFGIWALKVGFLRFKGRWLRSWLEPPPRPHRPPTPHAVLLRDSAPLPPLDDLGSGRAWSLYRSLLEEVHSNVCRGLPSPCVVITPQQSWADGFTSWMLWNFSYCAGRFPISCQAISSGGVLRGRHALHVPQEAKCRLDQLRVRSGS